MKRRCCQGRSNMSKRRANHEGTIRRRTDGRWEARIQDGVKADGRPNLIYFYAQTQKEVKKKLACFLKEKETGLNTSHCYTFEEFADFWYSHHCANITPTTQESYKYTLRILKSHFGNRYLTDIKAIDVEDFLYTQLEQGRSKSALAQCRGMLYQIFHKAEANDFVHKNPVRFADKMRSREPIKRKEAFTADEVRLLLQELPRDRMGDTIRLMIGTGMRGQEVLALEKKHISEDGSMIQICQATNMIKGTVTVGIPKSRDSYRDIPVPPNLQQCARNLRNTDKRFVWEVGKPGTPCNPSYFRDKFKAELEKIEGVRVLTPHCCRHTFVSQMQALGVDLATIQAIAGHADLEMTKHYLHVQQSIQLEAANRFAQAFGPIRKD